MATVTAHRIRQFGVEFYQAAFSAAELERLVRFEVLGYGSADGIPRGRQRSSRSRVNWELLESRIGETSEAYQRPVIRKKIDELAAYFTDCREAGKLPAIPGAVIITADRRLTFRPIAHHPALGALEIPEEPGILRVLDGQHRLLALNALATEGGLGALDVPAVVFDSLDAQQIVELFVTINAKHTRLNPSHLVSLSGRKLYPDENQALAHDIIRGLNEDETSPLQGEVKMLGIGRGKVAQAPLAEEIVDLIEAVERMGGRGRARELRESGRRFFLNYVKALAQIFPHAWAGRKYSIKTGTALRAFVRVAPDVMARARELRGDPYELRALREAIRPWAERLGDARFETEGTWRQKLAGGTRGTVETLARELREALRA